MFKDFKYMLTNIGKGEYGGANPLTRYNIERFSEGRNTLFVEEDPTVPSWVKNITSEEIITWNDAVNRYAPINHTHPEYENPILVAGDNISITPRNTNELVIAAADAPVSPNNYVTGGSFGSATGDITLTRQDLPNIVFPINGRFALLDDQRIINGQTAYDVRITGLSITGTSTKTITINLANGTSVTGSFTDISTSGSTSDGNDYVTSGSFNTQTGEVTLTRIDGGTIVFNLDNRYSLIGHGHSWDQITGKPTTFPPDSHTHGEYLTQESDPTVPPHVKSITDINISNWNTAFNKRITGISVTGTSTKTITLTFADNTTLTGTFTDMVGTSSTSDGNNYLTGVSGSGNGNITFTREGLANIVHNFAHNHNSLFGLACTNLNTILSDTAGYFDFRNFGNPTLNQQPDVTNNANGVLTMVSHSGGYGKQLAFSDNEDLWLRKFTLGVFSTWRKFWHSGNFDPSNFATSSHTHDFDKYVKWSLGIAGAYSDVLSGGQVNFVGSGYTSITKSGSTVTIQSTGDGNNYPTSLAYDANGNLIVGRNGLSNLSVNLDGRFAYRKAGKQISASSYTILPEDVHYWLIFTGVCKVTIPTGLLEDDLFEGECDSGGSATFFAASGVTLRKHATIGTALSANGVFGIRFKINNNCILYGTDPI